MDKRQISALEDVTSLEGQVLFESDPMEISVEQIQAYCRAIGQDDWFHFDEARAKASSFGGIVAPGTLTIALLHPTYFRHVELINLRGLFRGINEYRVRGPVIAGDRLVLRIEVQSADARDDGFTVTYQFDWRKAESDEAVSNGTMSVRYWPESADP